MNIRFLSVIAAIALVLPLVGCKKADTATETAPVASEQTQTASAPSVATQPVVKPSGGVVARVNGKDILAKDMDAMVQSLLMQMTRLGRQPAPEEIGQFQVDVLEEMIGRELVLAEGARMAFPDIDTKVQAQIQGARSTLGGQEALLKALADTGITFDDYLKNLTDNMIIQETIRHVVERDAKVAPEDIQTYYAENPDQFKVPEMVRASHILIRVPPDATEEVKAEKLAQINAARSLIEKGDNFADVARNVSEDPGSGANGGDLGFFPRGVMVPEFDTAAHSLNTNELSGVITTQFGYHVLLVTDKREPRTLPLEEVQDDIERFLKSRKGGEIARAHVAELRKAAQVEIFLPQPPAPAPVVETAPVQAPQP